MKEQVISRCEREFIKKALEESIRLDGRQLLDGRDIKLHFGSTWGCCVASLGQTQVTANVSSDIQQPKLARPNEGMLYINVELNPLAAPHFEAGRQSETGSLITRQLEKCFKDSKCIDLEALCIVADKKVWNIRVDVNVLNHDGNLIDCASIATLAALSHFHRPDVTSTGDEVIIHSFSEKDPLPLTLFHHPVCVSFTTMDNGVTVMDPTYMEERLGVTQLTLGLNAYRELCCLYFDHTARSSVSTDVVSSVVNGAANCAISRVKKIREAVKADIVARYNKEAETTWRLNELIKKNEITSIISQRLQIQLSQWNKANAIKTDDEIEMIVEEPEVKRLAKGSAELILNMGDHFGTGGPTTWNVESASEDEDQIKIAEDTEAEKSNINDTTEVLSDSEDEIITTLNNADL